jgi:hypothetical protein
MPEWHAYSGSHGAWEAFWWDGRVRTAPPRSQALPGLDKHFPDAGIIIHRSTANYLAITNGIVGTKGFGNHKHNDLLSFEYHPAGIPLIVDPGSYVYTSDLDARNLFRGTGYHNTLMVDGVEQNETNPAWIFRLFETANPETLEYRATPETLVYVGRHQGYTRLEQPVVHQRGFTLEHASGTLTIVDRIEGAGKHILNWHFHLAPGIDATIETGYVRLGRKDAGPHWRLAVPAGVRACCVPAWYSPSYGVRTPCQAIELDAEIDLSPDAPELFWQFSIDRLAA